MPSPPYPEEDLLPISGLQHLLFCERQCALIHVEGLWADNDLTVEGQHLHERVDRPDLEHRGDMRIARGVALQSLRLGLTGRADAVEYHADGLIVPVEYKRGRPKRSDMDRVQLCAQAICLEEMHCRDVRSGALYYAATRRRERVGFDAALREATRDAVRRFRNLVETGSTPRAVRAPKCRRCSLVNLCLPDGMSRERGAAQYLALAIARSLAHEVGSEIQSP